MPRDLGLREALRSGPLLQIALDLVDLELAARLGSKAFELGFDVVEAGTPLIKKHGMAAVERLRRELPRAWIVADTKTADAGALEVEIAHSGGADAVSVLALAGGDVLGEAVRRGRELGVSVWVDMIHVEDVFKKAAELRGLGPDLFLLHVGVDAQARRSLSAEDLEKEVRGLSSSGLLVGAAGGIGGERILRMASAGAVLIVVGGWITRSPDPVSRMREAVDILRRLRRV